MGGTRRWKIFWLIKGLGVGGAEQLLRAAIPFLDTERLEYQVGYLLPWKDALADAFRTQGLKVHCFQMRHNGDVRVLPRLISALRRERIDLLHAHLPVAGILGRLAARAAGIRAVVYTEHNVPQRYTALTRILNRMTYRLNDAVIAVSDEVRRGVEPYVAGGRPHLVTIQNAVDVGRVLGLAAGAESVREEFGFPRDTPLVITVGNLTPKKGHTHLLSAAARLLSQHPKVRFLVVGQGPLDAALREETRRLGLDGNLIFTGFRPDAVRLVAAADVFVLPSIHEGLPVALLEAMTLGKPTVVTRTGGVPEVATEESGFLIEPEDDAALADRLNRLLTDPRLRSRMGQAAQDAAMKRNGMDKMVRAIEDVYRGILET